MKILHAMIRVKDIDASMKFYTELLGLKKTHEIKLDDCILHFLKGEDGDFEIELTQNFENPENGYTNGNAFGHFAVETGPEPAGRLKSFLDGLGSRGVAVNLDPANLVMCAGDDPVRAVHTLQKYIVHTHAKDGIQLRKADTRRLYAPQWFGLEPEGPGAYREVPLGEGNVDWNGYIAALREIGYDGYLTIERECGERPAEDIAAAAEFLKKFL